MNNLVTDLDPTIQSAASSGAANRRLMIVDDDPAVREALTMIFRGLYDLTVAQNGYEAIENLEKARIDSIILDIRMPGLSGIETLGRLKKIDPAIEVIILTAFETIETAREALRLGACDYLSKPCEVKRVREAVEHAMKRRSISNEVHAHHSKLRELQEEVQEQQAKGDLAWTRTEIYASVLHDINGPLTVIAGLLELMADDVSGKVQLTGPALMSHWNNLAMIRRQVDSCQDISRRYLSFLKGRPETKQPTNVNQTLLDLQQLLKIHPHARRNKLEIHALKEEVTSPVNATDLIQILVNLTINALQSSPSCHEVTVRGEVLEAMESLPQGNPQEERLLNLAAMQDLKRTLKITVTDNGPGMPPQIMDRIFEPYFTTKSSESGTGLGLSIVRRLVEQSKGALHLRSIPGQGTTFSVYLPI